MNNTIKKLEQELEKCYEKCGTFVVDEKLVLNNRDVFVKMLYDISFIPLNVQFEHDKARIIYTGISPKFKAIDVNSDVGYFYKIYYDENGSVCLESHETFIKREWSKQ